MAHLSADCAFRVSTPTGNSYYETREDADRYANDYRAYWQAARFAT
jgi:hypothetical protein